MREPAAVSQEQFEAPDAPTHGHATSLVNHRGKPGMASLRAIAAAFVPRRYTYGGSVVFGPYAVTYARPVLPATWLASALGLPPVWSWPVGDVRRVQVVRGSEPETDALVSVGTYGECTSRS